MPTLSSKFISYSKALRKPKGFANSFRRFESPDSPSQHPYASPDIVHITPIQTNSSYSEDEDHSSVSTQLPLRSHPDSNSSIIEEEEWMSHRSSARLTPIRPSTPPQKLDVELPSDSMSDWIPSHLLDENIYNGYLDTQTPGAGSSKVPEGSRFQQEPGGFGDGAERFEDEDDGDDEPSVYEVDEFSTSSADSHAKIVANLEAMDASSFVKTRGIPAFRKTAPSPIKIPNPSFHGPKVQVIRSSGGSKTTSTGYLSSRPDSVLSGEDYPASAVSGTTLARALIGNSFVLSGDERTSRYRSGGSVLTRTDSATLPRDDNSSFPGSPTPFSHASDAIPLPANADMVYIPPKNPRNKRPRSSGSLRARSEADGEPASLVRPNSIGPQEEARWTSRISETDSSPSIPGGGGVPKETISSPKISSPFLSPNSNADRRTSNGYDAASSTGPSPTRPSSSTSSDNMLDDYYSHAGAISPATPDTASSASSPGGMIPIAIDGTHFRPPFSPITEVTEESSSQLSPPTPYRRDSRRSTKNGTGAGSPNGPRGPQKLLPIGENSQSLPGSQSPSPLPSASPASADPDSASSLAPPPVFSLFNRQRSGSAPNPIKIVRDSQDLTSYNIISTRPVSSSSSPTSSPEYAPHDFVKQTFPETPHAFSPMWSAGLTSPGAEPGDQRGSMDQILIAVPPTPMTAGEPMPALAQHMLARAASSVRGARHSRQPSGTRVRTVAVNPLPQQTGTAEDNKATEGDGTDANGQGTVTAVPPEPVSEDEVGDESRQRREYLSWVTQEFPNSDVESLRNDTATSPGPYEETPPAFQLQHRHPAREDSGSSEHSDSQTGELTLNTSQTLFGAIRGLPQPPPSPSIFGVPPLPFANTYSNSNQSLHSPVPPAQEPGWGSTTSLNVPPPSHADAISSQDSLRSNLTLPGSTISSPYTLLASPHSLLSPHALEFSQHPPPNVIHSQQHPMSSTDSMDQNLEMGASSMGSPPPYYTLVFDQSLPGSGQGSSHADNPTPTSGGSNMISPNTPPSSRADSSRQSTSSFGAARRGRSRPPLPLGPRRPTGNMQGSGSGSGRQRNGSISSLNSNPTGAPYTGGHHSSHSTSKLARTVANVPQSPRFQTPGPKWRGYTMDAAKWTFTSAQLQAIVSRAIKQSSEATAIRLLRLETVESEIPAELHRLEMQRTEVKTRYKIMTRRRTDILAQLMERVDGTVHNDDSSIIVRIINDLGDVCATLDRLAEELHSVDEQISQLMSLRDVHDASALAMAIRKLNASFLKQLSISEEMRSQVMALEAERDDAWKQAETVASDFDKLSEKVVVEQGDLQSGLSSNRSSRVTAMRKSSIRVSKAGLRSVRSSMSSTHRLSSASFSTGIKSAFSVEDVPPVPPIPRPRMNRPMDISTDLPSTRSFMALSTDAPTPNTETRAIYEELCDMLGLRSGDFGDLRPRRSQSVIERTRRRIKEDEDGSFSSITSARSSTGRPLSMPDRSGLTEVYQNMSADGNAMLATLGLLDGD